MAPWPVIVVAGIVIGLLTGLFGVGGSSIATPLLSLLGVPGLFAVASPLPATIPSAAAAALPFYMRAREARPRAAAWTLLGAVPATLIGALLADIIGGPSILVASGIVLVFIGLRVLPRIDPLQRSIGAARRRRRPLLVAVSAVDWASSRGCSRTEAASSWCRCISCSLV